MNNIPRPSLLRRLAALLYDSILICALLILIGGLWVSLAPTAELKQWGLRIIFIGLLCCFYMYFWLKGGQTLGMTAWRIKLQRQDGERPNYRDTVVRLLSALISITPLGLGFIWMLIDKKKLTWHDRLSKTELELLPKASKK